MRNFLLVLAGLAWHVMWAGVFLNVWGSNPMLQDKLLIGGFVGLIYAGATAMAVSLMPDPTPEDH